MIVPVNSSPHVTKVFISYCHKDVSARTKLLTFLSPLVSVHRIEVWDDRRIPPGSDWQAAVDQALNEADIAILILTADYLDSSLGTSGHLPKLLAARAQRGLSIVPIIWSPCAWKSYPALCKLQPLPRDKEPIVRPGNQDNRDHLLQQIVEEIDRELETNIAVTSPVVPISKVTPQAWPSHPPLPDIPTLPTQPVPGLSESDAYIVTLPSDVFSVDVLTLISRLKQQAPRAWLWNGGAFQALRPGRGDKSNPDRLLRVSWTAQNVVMEMNPVGIVNGQPLPEIVHHLVRPSSGTGSKKYLYCPFGKSQPYRYEVDVRFGIPISVQITDISSTLPDLKRSPTLQLLWSSVGN